MYIIRHENKNINKLKQSVLNELKQTSLAKKDRVFLLTLIELFDGLSTDEDERFLTKLEKLALAKEIQDDEEFKIRLLSLQVQLDSNRNLKTIHYPIFSMYYQTEKIEIYIKKLPISGDDLVEEIKKVEFDFILVNVYKTANKKEKLLERKIKKNSRNAWNTGEDSLKNILDNHIHTNIKIVLFYKKEKL